LEPDPGKRRPGTKGATLQKGRTQKVEAAPERRKRRSPEDLMNRILEAAAEEFQRSGYAGATPATRARSAEVTEAQLFRYFGSKANLFREAIFKPLDAQLQHFLSQHELEVGQSVVRDENAALYIEDLQRFLAANADMLTTL